MSIIRPATSPPRPDDRIRDRPRLTDRQRVDALLDELAWQIHLRELCEHAIDILRDQNHTLVSALLIYERTDTAAVRNKYLGSSK